MSHTRSLFFTLIAALAPALVQAQPIIRIHCAGPADGAKVYINGEFKGDCPADLFLASGLTKLRVVKNVDAEHIRVFEKEMHLVDGSVKRVKVALSAPQLSPQAIAERERKAAELKAAKLRQKALQEKQAAADTLAKAKQGDAKAMRSLAALYQQGKGLEKSTQQADYWIKQAEVIEQKQNSTDLLARARQGHITSMLKIAKRYRAGLGIERNNTKALYWEKKAETTQAEHTVKAAEGGDIKAMRELAERYAAGKGVGKDAVKSQQWTEKAEQAELEAQKAQQEWAEEYAKMQKLDELEYFKFTKKFGNISVSDNEEGVAGSTSWTVTFGVVTVGLLMDIVSTPFNLTKHIAIKTDLAARPSAYHNPGSMIAKAYKAQQ